MTNEEFDRLMTRAADPNLIPGIYNYCDRRCERCRFSSRCLSYLDSREAISKMEPGESLADAAKRSIRRTLELVRLVAERQGIDLTSPAEDQSAREREYDEKERQAMADPLVVLSRQYAMTSAPITRALWPIVMARGDADAIDALETIECLSLSVSSKVHRAVSGALDDFDADEIQSDVNGSAKIARILIDDSRNAWRVLMKTGKAAADGVPARLVNLLDQLDAAVALRFPNAMQFVRPGFDTEPATAVERDLDPALALAPQGHV